MKEAPTALMTDFLQAVSDGHYESALSLLDKVVEYEPDNKLMREYRSVLERAIKQEQDELSTSEEETTEDDPTSNEDSSTSDAQEEDDTTSEEASTVTSEEMRDELDNFGLEGTKKELMGSRAESERLTRALKDAQRRPGNRRCADCLEKAPNYCQLQFRTFICGNCAAVHREMYSPKVVKSVSMAEFTIDEVKAMRAGGNEAARAVWMSGWTPEDMDEPSAGCSRIELRRFLEQKYERKRWTGEAVQQPRVTTRPAASSRPQPTAPRTTPIANPRPAQQQQPQPQATPSGKTKLHINVGRSSANKTSTPKVVPPTAAFGSLRLAPPPGQQKRLVPPPSQQQPSSTNPFAAPTAAAPSASEAGETNYSSSQPEVDLFSMSAAAEPDPTQQQFSQTPPSAPQQQHFPPSENATPQPSMPPSPPAPPPQIDPFADMVAAPPPQQPQAPPQGNLFAQGQQQQQQSDPFAAATPTQQPQAPPQGNPFAQGQQQQHQSDPFAAATPTQQPQAPSQGNPFSSGQQQQPQPDPFAAASPTQQPRQEQRPDVFGAPPPAQQQQTDPFGAVAQQPSTNPFAQPASAGTNPFGAPPPQTPTPPPPPQAPTPPPSAQTPPPHPAMTPQTGVSAMMMSGPSPSASGVTFSANEIALLDAGAKFEKVKVLGSTNDRATVMGRDQMTREVESKKLLKLSNDLRFVQNDEAFYEMGGRIERCRIVEVHQDAPDEEPYFTIRLSNTGRERTTDSPHLLKPLEARSGESAGGGEVSDDPFSELVGGDVAVSSSTAPTAIPSDFAVNDSVTYTVKGSKVPEPAVVVRVHYDAGNPPYYTIRLVSTNAERQTDGARLSKAVPQYYPQQRSAYSPQQQPAYSTQQPQQQQQQAQYHHQQQWQQPQHNYTPQKQYSPQPGFSPTGTGGPGWQQQPQPAFSPPGSAPQVWPQQQQHQQPQFHQMPAYGGPSPPQQNQQSGMYPPF